MYGLLRSIALMAATLASWPLAAQISDIGDRTDAELLAVFTGDPSVWNAQPCEVSVPVMAELRARHPDNDRFIGDDLVARALCAGRNREYAEGARHVEELERRFGAGSNSNNLGLYFAWRLKDGDAILVRLRSMDSEAAAQLQDSSFSAAMRVLRSLDRQADLERVALHWQDTGGIAAFDEEDQPQLAVKALRAALKADRTDVAPLLALVRSPADFLSMLADRSYSAVWPQIEQHVGDHLQNVTHEQVEHALRRLETNAVDPDRLADASRALLFAGRFRNVIALVEQGRDGAIEEGEAWAISYQAYAHDALGEQEKADALFDELAQYSPKEHRWAINFIINRGSRLVNNGRWGEGLAATTLAGELAEDYGSTYAQMITADDRICALANLGRGQEGASALAFLRNHHETYPTLAAEGLLCAGQREEAAAILIAGLENEEKRGGVIDGLQGEGFDVYHTPSVLPRLQDLLQESEALRQAFNRYGRAIPQVFSVDQPARAVE